MQLGSYETFITLYLSSKFGPVPFSRCPWNAGTLRAHRTVGAIVSIQWGNRRHGFQTGKTCHGTPDLRGRWCCIYPIMAPLMRKHLRKGQSLQYLEPPGKYYRVQTCANLRALSVSVASGVAENHFSRHTKQAELVPAPSC